ncbi:MAG: hypothetical protein JO057_16085 [Chloroflexi bacterium]|nr:hypothetical protein [Chloroflexota bacterium]
MIAQSSRLRRRVGPEDVGAVHDARHALQRRVVRRHVARSFAGNPLHLPLRIEVC